MRYCTEGLFCLAKNHIYLRRNLFRVDRSSKQASEKASLLLHISPLAIVTRFNLSLVANLAAEVRELRPPRPDAPAQATPTTSGQAGRPSQPQSRPPPTTPPPAGPMSPPPTKSRISRGKRELSTSRSASHEPRTTTTKPTGHPQNEGLD